jgi:hypothetical protein
VRTKHTKSNGIGTAVVVTTLACLSMAPMAFAQKFQQKTAPKVQWTAPARTQQPAAPQAAPAGCNGWNLMGKWQGTIVVALPNLYVDIALVLAPNGSYAYSAGQGAFTWMSHYGTYTIAQNGSDPYYQCVLTLIPDQTSIGYNPQNGYGMFPLEARNLMADKPQAFRASTTIARGTLILFSTVLDRNESSGMFSLERAQ